MSDPMGPPLILSQHEHEGIRYPRLVQPSVFDSLRSFHVREDDVWIITFPKSGTHWMAEIVGLIRADGDPAKVDRSLLSGNIEMINMNQPFPKSRAEELSNPLDLTPFLEIVDKAASPRTIMTHAAPHLLPQDLLKAKVVYVARNPKDVAFSWYKFLHENPSNPFTWETYVTDFMNERNQWGSWFEHVNAFWKLRDHTNVLFLTYEDLIDDLPRGVAQVGEHIGRPLSTEMLQRVVDKSTFSSMKQTYKNIEDGGEKIVTKGAGRFSFIRKGGVGKWKSQFTVEQNKAFDAVYQMKTQNTDLKMTFQ